MQKIKAVKGTALAIALSGVMTFTSLPSYAVLGDQVLQNGMTHQDVQELQQQLKSVGLFNGDITNYYGEKTEESVKTFQIVTGLDATGVFDLDTYKELQSIREQVVNLEPEVSEGGQLVFERNLSLDSRGADVRMLQESLKALGFLSIDDCTDYFGNQTEGALKAFQENQGLKADGIANLRTVEGLNRALKGRNIVLPEATRGAELGSKAAQIIETGKKYLGVRYSFGGSSPSGFDCSGFTSYVFKQNGISIPRATTGQATFGTKVSKSELKAGDLVIFSNTYKSGPSHTGIYIENGKFIHSSSTGSGGVIISDLNSAYYSSHFSYGRRVL